MMYGHGDTKSHDTHDASVATWRHRYLNAVKQCLKTRRKEDIAEAILSAKLYRRVRISGTLAVIDDESKVGELFRKRIYGMVLGTPSAWANFLIADIGIGDAALEEFKEISPFKGCILLLSREGDAPCIRGDVQAFRKTFEFGNTAALTQSFRQEFRPSGERKHLYVLQVLRLDGLSRTGSMMPREHRLSDPSFLRPSQVGNLFGSLVPPAVTIPPAAPVPAETPPVPTLADSESGRHAVAPEPPAETA